MGIVLLYNIDLLVGIFLLAWIMKKNRQSKMKKTGKVILHVAGVLGILVLTAVLLFVDILALGIIGPVPN